MAEKGERGSGTSGGGVAYVFVCSVICEHYGSSRLSRDPRPDAERVISRLLSISQLNCLCDFGVCHRGGRRQPAANANQGNVAAEHPIELHRGSTLALRNGKDQPVRCSIWYGTTMYKSIRQVTLSQRPLLDHSSINIIMPPAHVSLLCLVENLRSSCAFLELMFWLQLMNPSIIVTCPSYNAFEM